MKWYFIFRSNISDLPLAENGKYVGKLLFCLLFVFLIFTQLSAQNIQIRGTVKDVSGLPVAGANIVVKGTTQGTVSDVDGNFSVGAENGSVLVISFIGYQPKEVKISGQKPLVITLQ